MITATPTKPADQPAHYPPLVRLDLQARDGTQLSSFQSRASTVMKWAVGWHTNEETVILYSGDIGTLAFEIATNGQLLEADSSDDIIAQGRALRAKKYGKD